MLAPAHRPWHEGIGEKAARARARVIEQILYFLLGVFLATLVALLVLPAVWHRAVRLTTRRVEAAVPVSLFEVQADKDQQRAFFALNQRRLELQTEEMRATIVAHAATIETQRQRIQELEAKAAVGAEHQVMSGELQDQVTAFKARIAQLEAELDAAQAALGKLEGTHGALSQREKELVETLAARDSAITAHDEHASSLGSEIALLTTNLTATAHRLDVSTDLLEKERAAVTRLTEELTQEKAQLADEQAARAQGAREIAQLTEARDGLIADLAAARADLDASRAVLHTLEQRRASEFADAEAETRRMSTDLGRLRADHALMSDALEKARGAVGGTDTGSEGNLKPLKDSLADVAARLVALTARLEGPTSPLPALLTPAEPNGAGVDGASPSLADRIRALLAEAGETGDGAPMPSGSEPDPSDAPDASLEAKRKQAAS